MEIEGSKAYSVHMMSEIRLQVLFLVIFSQLVTAVLVSGLDVTC